MKNKEMNLTDYVMEDLADIYRERSAKMNLDQILNNYDNQKAYEYDDYVEEQEDNKDAYDDYLIQCEMDRRAEEYEENE